MWVGALLLVPAVLSDAFVLETTRDAAWPRALTICHHVAENILNGKLVLVEQIRDHLLIILYL